MKAGVIGSLKFKRLKRLLQIPDYAVAGVLESIWCLCVDQAKFGDVGRFSDDEIAAGIEWEGDATALVAALVDSKWLDRSPIESVRLVVHDWIDHAPQFVTRWISRQLGNAADLRDAWLAKMGLAASDGYTNGASRLAMASQTGVGALPCARQSNQTNSIQTTPNQDPPTPQGGESPPAEPDEVAIAWREFAVAWNKTPGVVKCQAGNESRRKSFRARLKERVLVDGKPTPWIDAAKIAMQRHFPLKLCESDPAGWKPDIDFFLRPASVLKVLEGKYDWAKNGKRPRDSGAGQRFDPAAASGSVVGW